MSETYYIYHLVGKKVGCTHDLRRRKQQYQKQYPLGIKIKILEKIIRKRDNEASWKFAGDREIYWRKKLGYNRGELHYVSSRLHLAAGEGLGGLAAGDRETSGQQTDITCPHCGTTGQTRAMGRWHFDNCQQHPTKGKQNIKRHQKVVAVYHDKKAECPHCGKIGQAAVMQLWHFDNCRQHPNVSKRKRNREDKFMTVRCPHCGKMGSERAMGRWHFDNCKKIAT